jgi:RND superfamily putative drug exporter
MSAEGPDPAAGRSRALRGAARVVTARPGLIVLVWAVLMAALAVQGLGLDKKLSVNPIYIDGTITAQEHRIAQREFGSEDAIVVMLRGPRAEVERQGRALSRRLESIPRALIVTPWTPGAAIEGLRPEPGVVALMVSLAHSSDKGLPEVALPVERAVNRAVGSPVEASIAGAPSYAHSFQDAIKEAAKVGERIALPVLVIVLLLVFRSVLAAAIPIVIGGVVVAATRGVIDLFVGLISIDSFAIGAVAMMGLALGVDYSLLVVSRYREEVQRREGVGEGGVGQAVEATMLAIGRSVVPAAVGLVVAMLVASQVVPGAVAVSVSIAIIIATVLSAISAVLVVPAFLMLLGPRLERWSLPPRRQRPARARWVANRPWLALPILFFLFVCTGLAFTLNTGTASFRLLPPEDQGRQQHEEVQRTLGPGWTSPLEIVMDGGASPVTTPARLHALARFQRRVERDPGVEAMAGFAALEQSTGQLEGFERNLVRQQRGLDRLDSGIVRVHSGSVANTNGLVSAAGGAGQLHSALGATEDGAGALASGLRSASRGSGKLSHGLDHASDGSGRLAEGTSKTSTGLGHLADALAKAEEKSGETSGSARLIKNAMRSGDARLDELRGPLQSAEQQLSAAREALQRMSAGRTDPQYTAALRAVEEASRSVTGNDPQTGEPVDPAYEGIGSGMTRAEGQFDLGLYLAGKVDKSSRDGEKGTKKLARLSARLDKGLRRLAKASHQISGGLSELARGGGELSPGLQRLSQGAERLVSGLGQIQTGAGSLAGGLGSGAQRSKLLSGALHRIDSNLDRQRGEGSGGNDLTQLRRQSPDLFRSGYFFLAGLDGSADERRDQAGFLVNLDHGGHAARMLVIPNDEPETAAARETTARLQEEADELGRETGTRVLVGGFGPSESDVNQVLRDQAPWTRLALAVVTFLILLPVVRSLVLPLLAAVINLLTLAATFGLLSLLFNGSLLGGPGYVDTAVLPATMVVIFGLAIDYEVFIFSRMREEYVRTGSNSAAVTNGLARTGHVVTGAAIIMIAVFLAFAVSPFLILRNFGVAQAIGVFIDAFIVRLIVIPSFMRMLGERSWWIPNWLDRLLPGGTPVARRAET